MTVDIAMLSEAQRNILRDAPTNCWFPVQWEGWRGMWRSLQHLGLAYPREPGFQMLSPLGLEVRALLLKDNSDAG